MGRKIIVKTKFRLIEMRPYFTKPSWVAYESSRKIKYTKNGNRLEKLKVFQKVDKLIVTIKKMDERYLVVYLRNKSNQEKIIEEKYIIVDSTKGPRK